MSQDAVQLVLAVAKRHGADPWLRIRVIAGGCTGLTWDWEIGDVGSRPGDLKRTTDAVTVVVDAKSATYVRGATIDAVPAPLNGLRPPVDPESGRSLTLRGLVAARQTCGCGESFSA